MKRMASEFFFDHFSKVKANKGTLKLRFQIFTTYPENVSTNI